MLVGHLRQGQGTVDKEIVELHVARLARREIARLDAVKLTVFHENVVHIGIFLETDNLNTIFRLLAGDIFHIDIAHRGVVAAAADLIMLVVEVDLQYTLLADAHLHILHVDVLNDAATTGVGLDAQYTLQLGGVHHTVVGIDILTATTDLAANHHATVTILHLTVADDNVLRRHITLTSITVTAALDGDAVIAGVEETILDQHAVTKLGIAAVTIRTVVDHLHPTNSNICRVQGMDYPEGRTQQGDVLHENTLALVEVDELGTQTILWTEDTLR